MSTSCAARDAGLSTLRNIEVLKITLYKDNIHYLLTILHRLRPGATRLRQLVVCHVCEDQPRRESLDQLSELKLDVALAEPPFTGLWNVMWRVVTDDCGNRGGRWTNAIEKRLCGLRKRGLVLFYDVEKGTLCDYSHIYCLMLLSTQKNDAGPS